MIRSDGSGDFRADVVVQISDEMQRGWSEKRWPSSDHGTYMGRRLGDGRCRSGRGGYAY